MNRAVFLDRDGILNEVVVRGDVVSSPRSLGEFRIIKDASRLVDTIKERGFLSIVVTNQPDIGRGLLSRADLGTMNNQLREAFSLDEILVAESGDPADPRRKPNPTMLLEAASARDIDLGHSWFVGDGLKDVDAGRRAGTSTILLETNYNSSIHGRADRNFRSLSDIANFIKTL